LWLCCLAIHKDWLSSTWQSHSRAQDPYGGDNDGDDEAADFRLHLIENLGLPSDLVEVFDQCYYDVSSTKTEENREKHLMHRVSV